MGGCISVSVFQAFQQSSLEKLDQQLSSMILKSIPCGSFQELQRENTPEIGTMQLYACFFGNYTKKTSWLTNQGVFRSDMTPQKQKKFKIALYLQEIYSFIVITGAD